MIKIALIGLGSMGKNHYRILKELEDNAVIVGLCDNEPLIGYAEPCYSDVLTMLENTKPDAVIIATPTSTHKEISLQCIENNAHLFIEKPAAGTVADAREIQQAAKANNIKSCVGHVERFNPVVQSLKNELKEREIYTISITRVGPFPPRIADVGVLTDLSVHDIDLMRFITGREIKNQAVFKSRKIHNHYEDNAVLNFELEENIIANLLTNWLTPFKKRVIEVACQQVYLEADLITQNLTEYSGYSKQNSYVVRDCHIKKDEPLLKEIEAFLHYVQTGEIGSLATVEDSIITLEVATQS